MIWTIAAELYPSRYRAKGMALSTASNWFWNFLLAFFTPFIVGDIDFRYGYVFAGCNVLGGLLVFFFVVEGQGKTLEEIDTMYLLGVKPWHSAKWVPPSPDEVGRAGLVEKQQEMGTSAPLQAQTGHLENGAAATEHGRESVGTDEGEKTEV